MNFKYSNSASKCANCIFKLFIFTLLVVNGFCVSAQTVYYVSASGSDANDGLSWSTSFATIQNGIDEAKNAVDLSEVWVAQGTYHPTAYLSDYYGVQATDVYKSIIMYSGVNVYGGFEGTETTKEIGVAGGRQILNEDTWEFTYPTIIDGSATSSYHTVWFASNGFVSVTYQGVSGIYIPAQLTEQTIMDGFTISGGFANINEKVENTNNSKRRFTHLAGGGVAIVGAGELHNCIVENNKAKYGGAGVAMFDGAYIHNCLIQNNEAVGANFYNAGIFGIGAFNYWRTDGAGVVAMGFNTQSIIDNCVIHNNLGQANDLYPNTASTTNNKTNNGGGVYVSNSILQNSLISSNNILINPSAYAGGSSASCGGGLYVYAKGIVDNCEITDNGFLTGSQNGAGIFMADYSTEASSYTDIILRNSFIHTNRAGGAVAVDAQYSTVENNIVANNNGAGIYGYGNCRRMRTVNCLVYNNSSTGWGHSTSTNNKENQLINSTIARNGTGVGIGNTNSYSVYNSIVWGNNANPAIPANTTVSYSAFSFTPPSGTGNIQLSTNNIDGPNFINPTTTHTLNITGWQEADFSLGLGSDCIDIALQSLLPASYTTDIAGNNRVLGCNLDMGAYESLLGGPVLSLASNNVEFGQSSDISVCENNHVEIKVVDVLTGSLPFTISWTVNGSSTHALAGNNVVITALDQIILDFDVNSNYLFEFTAIADNSSCQGNPNIYNINVEIYQPEVLCVADFIISDENPVLLEGSTPIGGTYSGTGVNEGYFSPAGLTNGQFPIIYSYTDIVSGCSNSCEFNIILEIPAEIADVDINSDVADIELCYGTSEAEALLAFAQQITILDINDTEYLVNLTWLIDSYNPNVPDTYTATGSFDLPVAVVQTTIPTDLFVTANLVLKAEPQVNITAIAQALNSTLSIEICDDENFELLFIDANENNYPYTLSWTVNGSSVHSLAGTDVIVNAGNTSLLSSTLAEGTYEIAFTLISDATNCEALNLTDYVVEVISSYCVNSDIYEAATLSVYPNPANDVIYVDMSDNDEIKTVKILNILGEIVYYSSEFHTQNGINIKDLTSGTYFLVIENGGQQYFVRLVKN